MAANHLAPRTAAEVDAEISAFVRPHQPGGQPRVRAAGLLGAPGGRLERQPTAPEPMERRAALYGLMTSIHPFAEELLLNDPVVVLTHRPTTRSPDTFAMVDPVNPTGTRDEPGSPVKSNSVEVVLKGTIGLFPSW